MPTISHQALVQAIGEFVVQWSSVEDTLFRILCRYSGTSEELVRAFAAGSRAVDMMEIIKRVVIATQQDQQVLTNLESVLPKIKLLSTFRDSLMHRQWLYAADGKAVLANLSAAKSKKLVVRQSVASAEIYTKIQDVVSVQIALQRHLFSREEYETDKRGLSGFFGSFPWFDMPLGPATPQTERATESRLLKRQSRAKPR